MNPRSKTIDALVDQIVENVHPISIILFGSTGRGTQTPESDIDVLVVMPEGSHRRRTAQALYRQIKGIGIPFDIIVATPRDLEEYKDNVGLIYHQILREGVHVYGA